MIIQQLFVFGVLGVYDAIKTFVDKLFRVPIAMLDLAKEKIVGVGQVMRQGLDFSSYMSFLWDLPREWQLVVSNLLIVVVLLASLMLFRLLLRLYYTVKSGVQWW